MTPKSMLLAAAMLMPLAAHGAAPPQPKGWISYPGVDAEARPVVLHFRRVLALAARPPAFRVRVTADNRFILYVNGARVATGPSTGDVAHWREESIDLAAYLKRGNNVIAATVWNGVKSPKLPPNPTQQQMDVADGALLFTNTAPMFQQSVASGFRLIGEGVAAHVSTTRAGWRVQRDAGWSFGNGWAQEKRFYYVAGNPERVDAATAGLDANGATETGPGWQDAIAAPAAAARTLITDKLPPQRYVPAPVGRVVRSDLPGGMTFPRRAITVPANTRATLLIQRDAMISAYPELTVAGGAGATIKVTWSEALYDAAMRKGNRDLVGDRKPLGIWDTFIADGKRRTFSTLWWRTWRYVEIAVETRDAPLTLEGMRVYETGYPFQQIGRFTSDDPALARIFDIGWRTAKVDAHETYMDTAFWEQLQYAGDTRLQMLISYAVSGDARLAEQAIDAFGQSDEDDGLMRSAYPSRSSGVIAPFALLWVGMLDDWRMHQRDTAPITRNLDRMRRVLDWFEPYRQPSGLLGKNPQWNFIDWTGQAATDRDRFPSYGKSNESCLTSVSWLGALEQGARIEEAFGDAAHRDADERRAEGLKQAIRARCWAPARGLFADNPDGAVFSQHMNALAVLYDVVPQKEARAILDRITAPGKGIDAPAGTISVSYYFAWYLAQAYVHAGLADRYLELIQTWRDLLTLNYTTWPEDRDTAKASTRSDSHAWSAHPTADLLGIVAGIGPGAPGYSRLRIAPALGGLKRVDATAATPAGPVSVHYRVTPGHFSAEVTRPAKLPGEFVWQGQSYPLGRVTTILKLPGPR